MISPGDMCRFLGDEAWSGPSSIHASPVHVGARRGAGLVIAREQPGDGSTGWACLLLHDGRIGWVRTTALFWDRRDGAGDGR